MDRINKNNFEAYFLDFHEGRLNPEEEKAVMAFVQENPECFDSFEDYDSVTLPVPDVNYPDKSDLFRTEVSMPEADEWEYLCIAYMEGDLSGEELADFKNQARASSDKQKTLDFFLVTKSIPDETVQYENKKELKKKTVLIPRWMYGAVAAAAILILGWIIISPFGDSQEKPIMAEEKGREVIYFDKLLHPGINEKFAFTNDTSTRTLKPSSVFMTVIEDSDLFEIEPIARENILMASIGYQILPMVKSGNVSVPTSSEVFVYRTIPGIEDEEYQTLLAFSGDFIRKQLLDQDPDLVERTKFSFWELADAGLEKVSKIFGSNADIEREYSESGELMAVSFESSLLGFNTPIRRRTAKID